MDVLAHGLWGGVLFGRKTRWQWRGAFLFGTAPDLLAFGPFFISQLGSAEWRVFPLYVHQLYNITHSLVIWAVLAAAFWLMRKKFVWIFGAWALHILFDIPLHELSFFPTPYLWPFHTPLVDGMRWSQPAIMIPNYLALILAYAIMIGTRHQRQKAELRHKTVGTDNALR